MTHPDFSKDEAACNSLSRQFGRRKASRDGVRLKGGFCGRFREHILTETLGESASAGCLWRGYQFQKRLVVVTAVGWR